MKRHHSIFFFLFFLLVSCSDGNAPSSKGIDLRVEHFAEARNGSYELWLSFPDLASRPIGSTPTTLHGDEEFISVGKFNVRGGAVVGINGAPVNFALPEGRNLQFAIDAVITFQPTGVDTMFARLCGGAFRGDAAVGTAELQTSDFDAFGNSLLNPSGAFRLYAQSGDYRRGVWFANAALQNTLNLRFLTTSRWLYEARLVRIGSSDVDTVMSFSHPSLVVNPPNNLIGRVFEDGRNLADGQTRVELVVRPIQTASTDCAIRLLYRDIPVGASESDLFELLRDSNLPRARVTLRKQ
ncbi:MAG: hypothetical protein SNJ55_08315 [Chloroherpetonaceae bacterium]